MPSSTVAEVELCACIWCKWRGMTILSLSEQVIMAEEKSHLLWLLGCGPYLPNSARLSLIPLRLQQVVRKWQELGSPFIWFCYENSSLAIASLAL